MKRPIKIVSVRSGLLLQNGGKLFSCAELDDLAGRDHNRILGLAGIASHALLTGLDFENTESTELNMTAVGEFFDHDVKRRLNGGSGIRLRSSDFVSNLFGDFAFCKRHFSILPVKCFTGERSSVLYSRIMNFAREVHFFFDKKKKTVYITTLSEE